MLSRSTLAKKSFDRNLLPAPSGIFGLTVFWVLSLVQGAKLLLDGDTYTHISVGQWMLDNDQIFQADVYSHTASGANWIAHEWGAEILMALLHDYGGFAAIGVFYAFLAALTFTILYRLMEFLGTPPISSLVLVCLTFLISYPHIYARPHLFTWLFLSLTLLICHLKGRWMLLLPIITMMWANLHGGFVIGIILQFIMLLGDIIDDFRIKLLSFKRYRLELLALFGSIAVCGLNPYGYEIFSIFATAGSIEIAEYNPEWWSPNFQDFWPFLAYLVVLVFVLLRNRENLRMRHLFIIAVFLEAAFSHRRHISLAVMCLLPVWQTLIASSFARISAHGPAKARRFLRNLSGWTGPIITSCCAFIMLIYSSVDSNALLKRFPMSKLCPQEAMNYIGLKKMPGLVYNDYSWGSCLIYEFSGKVPVFIDGFAEKYRKGVYEDYYNIAQVEPEAEKLLDEYAIDWILFPTQAPLTRYLLKTGVWIEDYRDSQASILMRASRSTN